MVPGIEAVPERMPKLTPAGNLSIAKLTKSVRNSYYLGLVCGNVQVTAREAPAVAPGLQAVRVAVTRRAAADAYGTREAECLLAAVFARPHLAGVRWQSADAIRIVQNACADLRIKLSASHELLPLDLSNEPSLAALLRAVDIDEAGSPPDATGPHAGHSANPYQTAPPHRPTVLLPPRSPSSRNWRLATRVRSTSTPTPSCSTWLMSTTGSRSVRP